jgi:hypothetical protein
MSATIKVFHVGGKCFTHVMNASHDSVELRDEADEILLTYGADAKVTNHNGQLGNFIVEYIDAQPRWVYYDRLHQIRTVFGPNLLTAEVEVSRRFIGKFDSFAAEHDQEVA